MQGDLLNFAYKLTSNKDEAHDLLQETTLKALDNQNKCADSVNFKCCICTLMKNIFIRGYHKIIRHHVEIDSVEGLYAINLPENSGIENPEDAYQINEIIKCINQQDEKHRVALSMHIAGFKYHEIATEQKTQIGTVKSRISHIRKELRKTLKDYDRK